MRTGELYQRYFGHYLATVIDVNDPQKLGRIRVQSDQFGDTMDQPIWASISRPAAGNKQGVFFTPKNGDQVILGFIAGDVREPMVMGYAHSTQAAPASVVGTQQHGIVTSIGSVVFDEQNSIITVAFTGSPQSKVTLNSSGITLQVGDSTSVTLDSSSITLKAADVKVQVDNAMDVS
jgi:uncharacterized protein involved in type VI secretion and phage assembly